jgi:hypothetical protein
VGEDASAVAAVEFTDIVFCACANRGGATPNMAIASTSPAIALPHPSFIICSNPVFARKCFLIAGWPP